VWAIEWIARIPHPGFAVAVLAVVAAVMSVHPDMQDWQKLLWILLIGVFLVIEFRALDKDRSDNEVAQAKIRSDERDSFKKILDQDKENFLKTLAPIRSTLESSNKILKQTAPHAFVHFTDLSFASPTQPTDLYQDVTYTYNIFYINDGNENARITKRLVKIYYGLPNNRESQLELTRKFEEEWKTTDKLSNPIPVVPGKTRYVSESDKFALGPNQTIYFLRRFEYTDSTGTWLTDDCDHFAVSNSVFYIRVTNQCLVFVDSRYRPKKP